MGKATMLIGLWLMISMVASLVAVGLQSADPSSSLLASNALFGSFNTVYSETYGDHGDWYSNKDYATVLPSREAVGNFDSPTATLFPDWIFSGLDWIKVGGSIFLNMIGAPYTLCLMMSNSAIGAIMGVTLSIFNLFIIVAWILGKVD